jgi:hypothetical protein
MKPITLVRLALLAAAATAILSQIPSDSVTLQCLVAGAPAACPSGVENGVLLISKSNTRADIPPSVASIISVGNVAASYHQVVSFRSDRAPGIDTSPTWAPSYKQVTVKYPELIQVPLQVWVVCPYDANDGQCGAFDKNAMNQFLIDANAVLQSERVGIRLIQAAPAAGWVSDETANTQLQNFLEFRHTKCVALNAALASSGKKRPDAVNLYLVKDVDLNSDWGHTCLSDPLIPGSVSVVGHKTTANTMLHEIGHALSLVHVTPNQPWDGRRDENYMFAYSDVRQYFTEGQTFRIHFDSGSAINTLGLRNESTRACGDTDEDAKNVSPPCPPVGARIWPPQ